MPDDVKMRAEQLLVWAMTGDMRGRVVGIAKYIERDDAIRAIIAALSQSPASDDGLEEARSQALMTMEYAISLIVALKPEKARIYLEQQAAALRAMKKGDRP